MRNETLGKLVLLLMAALACGVFLAGCSSSSGDDDTGGTDDDVTDDDVADDDAADDDVTDDDAADDDAADDDVADDDTADDDVDDDHGSGDQVQNGGFETGDETGWDGEWPWDKLVWSESTADDDTFVDDDSDWGIIPHSGSYAAWFGQDMGDQTAWLGQTFDIPLTLSEGTVDLWYYMSKFGACTFTFGANLVAAADPATVLVSLGAWTEADAAFFAHYVELNYPLTADDLAALEGQQAVLRFDYSGHTPFFTGCYIYLDDVSFMMTW
jgi:hypothetical protein